MTDTTIHANSELITPPTTIGALSIDFALKGIAARLGPLVAQTDATKSNPNKPGGNAGRTAGDSSMGAAGGIAWRDHFDRTEEDFAARVDTSYGADPSSGITGTVLTNAKKVYGDGNTNSGAGDGLKDHGLGRTFWGGKQAGTLDDSQIVIAVSNNAGGAGYVQAAFTTDSTNPGVHGGTDTVDHVECYVYRAHDVDIVGSGETFASAPVEVYDVPGMFIQAEDYAAISPTTVGTLAASDTAYTTGVHKTVAAGDYVMVLVPIMLAGGDSTNVYVGPPVQVNSTAT